MPGQKKKKDKVYIYKRVEKKRGGKIKGAYQKNGSSGLYTRGVDIAVGKKQQQQQQ